MYRYKYFSVILFILLSTSTRGASFRSLGEVNINTYYPCEKDSFGVCVCKESCLELTHNNTECKLKDCYHWDSNLDVCEEAGPKFVPAIVLQAIPFTGAFGSGFGNIGRWDIFGVYMVVVFGPIAIFMLACCCAMGGFCAQNEDRLDCCKCLGSCFACLWGVAIVGMWIGGIVVIANKNVYGPEEKWYGNTIRCTLSG